MMKVEDVYVDWRGRPCNPHKHGGTRAAAIVLGLQAFEIMGTNAVENNLITYVFNEMHFSLSKSANIVTNLMGTLYLLSLLGGFLSDSYLGSYSTMLSFGLVELAGFILLTVQAHLPQLRPPKCNMGAEEEQCLEAKGFNAFILFLSLYLIAIGSGSLKPSIASHGANQFRKEDPKHSRKVSTFFNAGYFTASVSQLIALTILVWVQTHSGMDIGFGISALAMLVGLICLISGTTFYRNNPPAGSILTPIVQVFAAAFAKRNLVLSYDPKMMHGSQKFRCLDKACIKIHDEEDPANDSPWRLCTIAQVEQVKIIITAMPILACTIIFNTILAQLQTFSVQQGRIMDTHLTKNFKIPPASLQSIPYMMLIFLVPLYEIAFVPFARKITKNESGISTLQRIGAGLFLATFSMILAALMEDKRRNSAVDLKKIISIFWIVPQFLISGFAEMFTIVGLIEFFYKQSLGKMQSFLTAMTYCSFSFGFYFSSLLVSVVNKISSSSSSKGWLSSNDLNKDRLDLFYWLLAALNFLNFLNYLFWSKWYSYNPSKSPSSPIHTCEENENIIP